MTDYAEFLTEIDRLRREIHDACKAGEWLKAGELASQLDDVAYGLHEFCVKNY